MNLHRLRSSDLLTLSSFHIALETFHLRSAGELVVVAEVEIFSCRDDLHRLFIVTLLLPLLIALTLVVVVMRSAVEVRDDKINMVLGHRFDHLVHIHIEVNWLVIVVIELVALKVFHSVVVRVLALLDGLRGVQCNSESRQNVKVLFHSFL
jgi:heme/copper-type cytochrome/quinol oxidase subunit 2